jgi:hypothetical protein
VETWTMVELGTHLAYRQSACWSLSTYSRAPQIYPDPTVEKLSFRIRQSIIVHARHYTEAFE